MWREPRWNYTGDCEGAGVSRDYSLPLSAVLISRRELLLDVSHPKQLHFLRASSIGVLLLISNSVITAVKAMVLHNQSTVPSGLRNVHSMRQLIKSPLVHFALLWKNLVHVASRMARSHRAKSRTFPAQSQQLLLVLF